MAEDTALHADRPIVPGRPTSPTLTVPRVSILASLFIGRLSQWEALYDFGDVIEQ